MIILPVSRSGFALAVAVRHALHPIGWIRRLYPAVGGTELARWSRNLYTGTAGPRYENEPHRLPLWPAAPIVFRFGFKPSSTSVGCCESRQQSARCTGKKQTLTACASCGSPNPRSLHFH